MVVIYSFDNNKQKENIKSMREIFNSVKPGTNPSYT